MQSPREIFETMKQFMAFGPDDEQNLRSLAPLVDKHGPRVTDEFYELLAKFPDTARMIEGKVDRLKGTHTEWMKSLVAGSYGDAYFDSRWRIGLAHVRIGLDPFWPEAVMNIIRTRMMGALAQELSDVAEVAKRHASLTKACDLDLLVINLSYGEDRLERLTSFTGMKRALLENIIKLPKQ